MTQEIIAAINAVRLLGDMTQTGYEVSNANQINSAIAETLSKLNTAWTAALDAQEQKATLAKRVSELEKEIAELKNWDREAEGYTLSEIAPDVPAYMLKSDMERNAITHRLCANCFADRKKSFLQLGAQGQWACARCESQWFFPKKARMQVMRA